MPGTFVVKTKQLQTTNKRKVLTHTKQIARLFESTPPSFIVRLIVVAPSAATLPLPARVKLHAAKNVTIVQTNSYYTIKYIFI